MFNFLLHCLLFVNVVFSVLTYAGSITGRSVPSTPVTLLPNAQSEFNGKIDTSSKRLCDKIHMGGGGLWFYWDVENRGKKCRMFIGKRDK